MLEKEAPWLRVGYFTASLEGVCCDKGLGPLAEQDGVEDLSSSTRSYEDCHPMYMSTQNCPHQLARHALEKWGLLETLSLETSTLPQQNIALEVGHAYN